MQSEFTALQDMPYMTINKLLKQESEQTKIF